MLVLVQSQTSRKTRIVTGPMEKVVENIVRGRFHSLPKAVMDVPTLAPLVIKEVLKRVDKECHAITSFEFNSILRQTSPSALKDFTWDKVLEEWRTNAPTFMSFLETASTFVKTQNKKTPKAHRKKCTMAMAGSSLLQARCERMSAAMHRNSIILHHGNAKKGCHRRLAKLGICVSRQSTSNKLKGMSDSQDSDFEWMPVTDESWTTTADEEPRDNSSASSTCSEGDVKERLEMPVMDDDSGSDREDELPQVVVLKKGDLSAEEVTRIKGGTEKEDKPPADGKILFKKPTKRSSEKFQGITASSSKKKKQSSVTSETDEEKTEEKVKLGKVKNKSLLSFGDDEDED
uniref:DUF4604 domain-containing protein n=1 Tax=Esox lucius TaxID=8010 RepID=A0AAY5K462_ESOLU